MTAKQKARHALTGRGVTLAMLMEDKLIEAGDNVMAIEYLVRCYNDLIQYDHSRLYQFETIHVETRITFTIMSGYFVHFVSGTEVYR